MIKWTLEHPFMTAALLYLLIMAADNVWGNYMRYKISKHDKNSKGK